MDLFARIEAAGIVPVIKLKRADDAVALCNALCAGGLPVAEITFRTEAAEESIRRVSKELPHVLVGAGTVLSVDQAKKAVEAGAAFIVTPGFNPKVVGWCVENNIAVIPGCPTTSDIEQALDFGLRNLKFFPAEAMGGLNTIKAVSAPYAQVRFMPTGGINEDNMNEYLSFSKVIACGGSWMVKDELIDNGQFDAIAELTRCAVKKMLGFEIAHIGLNGEDAAEAQKMAERFAFLFGWPIKTGNSSIFTGTGVEVTKQIGRGAKGHIAIRTHSLLRARAYLEGLGVSFDERSLTVKDGKAVAIYLNEEIGGFALHLLQK